MPPPRAAGEARFAPVVFFRLVVFFAMPDLLGRTVRRSLEDMVTETPLPRHRIEAPT